ncbi:serine acetyltransferase [Bacillus sp. ISL-47]|nr:serine acetyltransferase [Bacillus sp. ISL-47]MBT2708656.1 serine acetyltransferase [Pseudomonas sp. ISL-84]
MDIYRLGNWCYKRKIPFVPKISWILNFLVFNSHIPYSATIGKNTKFAYGGIACVIHNRAIIGANCIIGSNVTIGGKSRKIGVPIIGDNVYLSTGSKILGDVKIGNGVMVGANAVVVKDIPDRCVVAGVPAKIIKENINIQDYI